MCCAGETSGIRLTRCGVVCGLAALAALSVALLGPTWLHTEEKLVLPNLPRSYANAVSVNFKLGLFRVCPKIVKPSNFTFHIPTPTCTYVRYSSLEDVRPQELGFRQLEFTPMVVSKIRISAPFQVVAAILILAATVSALIGHCYSDHRSLVACGLFLLSGLSLGGGLILLVSALSDASLELPGKYSLSSTTGMQMDDNGLPQYHYGWCLQLSGLALMLAEVAAVLTMSGYMARFSTVEEMVKVMVPGAERKLREQRGLSSEYLVRAHQKSPGPPQTRPFGQPTKTPQKIAEEGTSLLCKSAPDICASNPQAISYVDKADLSHVLPAYPDNKNVDPRYNFDKSEGSVIDSQLSGFTDKEGFIDSRILSDSRQNMIAFTDKEPGHEQRYTDFPARNVDQNVVDSRLSGFADKEGLLDSRLSSYVDKNESLLDTPFGYDTRFNTLAGQTVPIMLKNQNTSVSAIQSQYIYQNFGTIHSGILKVSEPGTSSSSNSSQRSMTLQNPKRKSQIAQNTFSTMECEKKKRASGLTGKTGFYTGSAV
ncbi:Voltage-dependent calcium channel gamma-5 subunit [Ooceraea biroi]|uniref:Voltage-dependent calcium channel gamma-5 subunit n=1 Tax=Ooceraea biroi TaxID=2015173 RepID=A0A026X3U9_OOCBI|nr:Voltage-dependent calcium channel gamma-5 subunit [Ooceraea biroi]